MDGRVHHEEAGRGGGRPAAGRDRGRAARGTGRGGGRRAGRRPGQADQAAQERALPGGVRRAGRRHEDRLGRHRAARPGAHRAGRPRRGPQGRALGALPRRADRRPRGQPAAALQRHRLPLQGRHRVRAPDRRPDAGRGPGAGAARGWGPRGDGVSAAALQPGERRVLAGRPGRAVGRPPQQPGGGRAAARAAVP
ncbi:hypothetical protein SBRY_50511 [Actinacidiphila bryophytorum]|uniref:Uncharacterized protein n=1 Tax=Actinacidiphila bryophytorum TaxID=1436133 RepID=A0A9W4H4V8_9ACTN|nr:hypothetical protein SBRY_50511 [Actinacidiphila bryophytorum]